MPGPLTCFDGPLLFKNRGLQRGRLAPRAFGARPPYFFFYNSINAVYVQISNVHFTIHPLLYNFYVDNTSNYVRCAAKFYLSEFSLRQPHSGTSFSTRITYSFAYHFLF